jgi:histidyl-tRNA synthetase
MALIAPRTPPGTMELLPRRQIAFQGMIDRIRAIYERFGFLPLETPVFETTETLLSKSGGETEKQVYFVQSTGALEQGKRPDLALRFDLTVPMARYVAQHERELAFPFRRYQIQRVYRGERAQKGRYREFYQCDIDVIGKETLAVAYDAEIPAVIHAVFCALDVGPFTININNRKLLMGFFESIGIVEPSIRMACLRQVDKLDKISREETLTALQGEGIGLSAAQAKATLAMIGFSGSASESLAHLAGLGIQNAAFVEGLAELRQVAEGLAAFGVPERHWRINLSIARGLDYYTGSVYETFLDAHPELGSVCSGGRYENLAGLYTKSKLPGVGISIGLTRLFYALEQAGLVTDAPSVALALVTQCDPALLPDCLTMAASLRSQGINTDVHLQPAKLDRQLKYADKAGIRFAIMLGADEKAEGMVSVKDLTLGTQTKIAQDALATWLCAAAAP